MRENIKSDRDCGHSLAEAIEFECPLVRGRKLPIETQKEGSIAASDEKELELQKAHQEAQCSQTAKKITQAEGVASQAKAQLEKETKKYDQLRAGLAQQLAAERAIASDADRAHSDKSEADTFDASVKDLEQKIRTSQDKQKVIREQRIGILSAFSETFDRVARAIFDNANDEFRGSIRFNGRKIRPTFTQEIDLTSAALETLKIICFDLAALVSGVEGRSQHPRFLIHDGPREADMDADLYQQIFRLARDLENAFGNCPPAFQYIITTTEPPPSDMQQAPWLLTPVLDATTADGKLLRENF